MSSPGRRALRSTALLAAVLLVAAVLLSLLLGPALLLPAVGWVALGMVAFITVQLGVFRLLGLRSRADDEPGETPREGPDGQTDDTEWRSWRG